jgi:hypothetical protein
MFARYYLELLLPHARVEAAVVGRAITGRLTRRLDDTTMRS